MTQETCDKAAILENGGALLKSLSYCYKNQKMSNKAVNYANALNLSLNAIRLKKCLTKFSVLLFLQYNLFLNTIRLEKCVSEDLYIIKHCLDRYKTREMCDKAADDFLPALKFVPDCFTTS